MNSVGVCSRRGHTVNKCYDLTKVPVSEWKAVLKSLNLCFRCLSNSKGHNFRRCTVKCFSCKGNHHALLCDKGRFNTNPQSVSQDLPTPNTTQSPNQSPAPNAYTATNMPTNAGVSHVGVTQSTVSSNTQVLLQIVRVPVRGGKRCLWCDCSFWYWCWPDLCHRVFSWPDWTWVGKYPYHIMCSLWL